MRDDNSRQQTEQEQQQTEQAKSVWDTLAEIDVSKHTEKKGKLTYLSWAWAWGIAKHHFPDISYKVVNYDGKPWIFDHTLGYMVQTEVTILGQMIPMHLFVMDGANKAQRCEDYTYEVKNWQDANNPTKKQVKAATMFDINTCIMRCLTKNLAMFGLGHYIYTGEDMPQPEQLKLVSKSQADKVNSLLQESNSDTVLFCRRLKIKSISAMPESIYGSSVKLIEDKMEKRNLEEHKAAGGIE